MANRIWDLLKALGINRVDLTGSFQPNGASTSPYPGTVKGNGFTVTHAAGTAQWTITFQDQYSDFDSAWCEVIGPNPGIQAQIVQTPDMSVNKQLVLQLYDTSTKGSGSQTDLAYNANTWVCFGVRAKNTSGNF